TASPDRYRLSSVIAFTVARPFLPLSPRRSRRASVVQKNALTAIVDQAHNSNKRPRLRGPTAKLPFGSRLTLSDRFYTPTLIRPDNEREDGTCLTNWVELRPHPQRHNATVGAAVLCREWRQTWMRKVTS